MVQRLPAPEESQCAWIIHKQDNTCHYSCHLFSKCFTLGTGLNSSPVVSHFILIVTLWRREVCSFIHLLSVESQVEKVEWIILLSMLYIVIIGLRKALSYGSYFISLFPFNHILYAHSFTHPPQITNFLFLVSFPFRIFLWNVYCGFVCVYFKFI